MEKRLLGMLLCCIMMIGMLPVSAAAASEERTCTLTADDSNAACGWLTGKIEASTIDTVPFIGTDSTGTYSLYTADAGVTLTVAEDLVGSDYRYTYSACLIRRDFADDGSVDWTHLEDYEGNPQVFTAADGAVKLPDGAYCLEINCEKTPLIAPAGSAASYTPVRVFLRVGLGKNIVNPFTDVPAGSYFCTPVLWAVDKGITSGTSASTFSPDDTCTRSQIITFLYRAAGCPLPKEETEIIDVPAAAYYYMAVQWAAENGMFEGNHFQPDAPCTRQMAVDFMWKANGSPGCEISIPFADIDSHQKAPVAWALQLGITAGTSKSTFSPNDACTRGQIVTFLFRALPSNHY